MTLWVRINDDFILLIYPDVLGWRGAFCWGAGIRAMFHLDQVTKFVISVYFYHYLDVKPRRVVIIFCTFHGFFAPFFERWHDLKVYIFAFIFNSKSPPPHPSKKNHDAFSSISFYGTKHHPGTHPQTKNKVRQRRPPGYHHVFLLQKTHQKINTQHKTPSVLSKQTMIQPTINLPPKNQPSTPLRAYLPINYFEPSKLLEACAAKQGTKVFPGQTLIDVVLKDGWVSVGRVGRWLFPPSRAR